MSAKVISALAQNSKLFDEFKADPIQTLKTLEQVTGVSFSNVSLSDIELIKTFTPDDFRVFVSLADRMNAQNKKNFQI